jgi:glycosyltransferase involved in cell wall biosynthesis
MNVLFIHHNYPAQYAHLAKHLGELPGHHVYYLTQKKGPALAGVEQLVYNPPPMAGYQGCHPYNFVHESGVRTGLAVLAACKQLKERGVVPDVIVGHSGWGETLFIKQVYPNVPLLAYFEFFYHAEGADVGYDKEFSPGRPDDPERLWIRNSINLLSLAATDAGHTATQWQRSLFPQEAQSKIHVLHEGVDTNEVKPNAKAVFDLPDGRQLRKKDEVITYVARNLEPYRGFHYLMRALPQVLQARPNAQVVLVGGDGVSYGDLPPYGGSWRKLMMLELADKIDTSRLHFVGKVPREKFIQLLQVSSLHVYFTYPFVLSWSCIEALSAGCLVLGSDVPPVAEAIQDGHNGLLVNMQDPDLVAKKMIAALQAGAKLNKLRKQARADAIAQYDIQTQCLPQWMAALKALVSSSSSSDQNAAAQPSRLQE